MHDAVLGGAATPASMIPAALQQALQSRNSILEQLPVGICTCDRDGVLVQYNRRAAELWGHAPRLGDPRYRFCGAHKVCRPDGEALPLSDTPLSETPMSEVLRTGRSVHDRKVVFERLDGTRITVLANLEPLRDETGEIIGGVNCFQDISELERAETKLADSERRHRDLIEALPAAVYTTDAEGRITYFNRAATELWGHVPELGKSEWCGSWRLYWPDGTPMRHDQCPMAVALKENRPIRDGEAVAERPDGTRVPFIPCPTPLRDAAGVLVGAVNMLVDISERKTAESRQKMLVDELNHRVKNTLATVQSLASQTARRAPSPAEFREGFEGRLIALSRAHDQLSQRNWVHADLREIAQASLAPYDEANGAITISGEPIELAPRPALTFAMIFHELATNAAKYGALSQPDGRLALAWETAPNGAGPKLRIRWHESGGPAVRPPARRGFGSLLVERGIEAELGGAACLDFAPAGVTCDIEIPLANNR
ncbi:MAG: hypothetical protein QOI12_4310 [Alphaproteobacteria bacterium]|jgi:PAS domain S-box-containing protein|nr:hypothetical protein [Alphaproteobacteria bacterium]